jgi:hypothetical protein
MLLEVDPVSLAKMADVLLRDRGEWSAQQWQNQRRFFAVLSSELERQALDSGQREVADQIHDTAFRFALAVLEGWPPPSTLDWPE